MQIAGYLKTSLIEWSGKITSVVFVPGCNFRCPFCHNRDLVRNRGLTLIDEKRIFADLKKRKKWVDGVVVTGGEPTLQLDLPRFLRKIKKMGFLTMIETNGSEPKVIASLLSRYLVDFVAMDIKGPFDEYERFTKVKSPAFAEASESRQKSKVKSSVEIILKSGVDYEFRTTVVPGLHNLENLTKLASQISVIANFPARRSPPNRRGEGGSLRQKRRRLKPAITTLCWFLQNFQPKNCLDPEFEKRKPFSRQELAEFLQVVRKIIPQTELRGV